MTEVTVTSTPYEVSVSDDGSLITVASAGPAGQGVPAGGSDGQVLKKSGGTNYVTEWAAGGSGDMLASNNLSELANDATARSNLGVPATNHNHAAGNITSGTLSVDRIPDLAASKITSGTIDAARIPTLATADHSADKVTSGTLAVARGGTGVTSLAMVSIPAAANATAARAVLELGTAALVATGTGDANAILGNDARLTDDRDPNAHSTDKLTSGTLPVGRGGTGLTAVTTLLNSNQAYSDISGTPTLGTAAALAVGISNTNVLQANAVVADDDFLRIDGTTVEGRTAAEVLSDIGAQASDADLTAIAGLTSAADKGIQFTGSGSAAVYDLTAAGKALLDDADAAAQRTTLGVTNAGSYTGHIETGAVKEYTLDPAVVTARTITAVFIQSGNQSGSAGGTGTIILKVKPSGGSNATIGTVTVSNSSGAPGSLANTSIAADARLFLDCTANSSMTDVIFSVEYTE